MKRTKFKIDVLKHGYSLEYIVKAIAAHNGGITPLSLEDFISYAQMDRAIFPTTRKGFTITRSEEEENKLLVSEDNGESYVATIEEIELHELAGIALDEKEELN